MIRDFTYIIVYEEIKKRYTDFSMILQKAQNELRLLSGINFYGITLLSNGEYNHRRTIQV